MGSSDFDLTILESLRPDDHRRRRLDGLSLVGPAHIFEMRVKYRHLATRREFLDAVEAYAGRSFALHISAHGGEDGLQTADDRMISWPRLARAVKASGEPSAITFSACAVLATRSLPDALSDEGLTTWLVGPSAPESDGIGFGDACAAFTQFYYVLSAWRTSKPFRRPLSTLRSDKEMMRDGLDRMHASSNADFSYYRWSEARGRYVSNDREDSEKRLAERFANV